MKQSICFDVDGTLITLDDMPRYDVIALFQFFEKLKWKMYVWSGGGVDYAEKWRGKLWLHAAVIEKGSIVPDIAVDDENVTLGVVNIKV